MELGALALELVTVDDQQWLNEWTKYYKPFEIGRRVVVKPVWEEYAPDAPAVPTPPDAPDTPARVVFNINPGSAFGTGMHQTTRLCVGELEKYVRGGERVLDLGCGSGILSIISLMLGAASAAGVDFDPAAVATARENAVLNGITEEEYVLLYGNVLTDADLRGRVQASKYDIVAANIVADAIVELSGFVPSVLAEAGVFITSGIIRERLDDVCAALLRNGFVIADTLFMDGWVCVVARAGGADA
jgi:ribosomal protein L11 methyltransferase